MEKNYNSKMIYRYLGNSGVRVSVLSWGNWINHSDDYQVTYDSLKYAFENGINFIDTAEIYGFGQAELCIGKALEKLKVPRENLVVSTKIYKAGMEVNETFLSRKHIVEGVNNSLKRLKLDYVDVGNYRFNFKISILPSTRSIYPNRRNLQVYELYYRKWQSLLLGYF